MNCKGIKIFLVCLLFTWCSAEAEEDTENEGADDPTSDWVAPGSSDDVIKVKSTTNVQVLQTKAVLPSTKWNTIQTGQTLLVRNWPCKVTSVSHDAAESVEDAGANDDAVSDTRVDVKVKVDVTSFQIGGARCLAIRRKNLIQRLSCASSDQCPDSGSVCKRVGGFGGTSNVNVNVGVNVENHDEESNEAMDYADPLENAEEMGDVSEETQDEKDPNDFSDVVSRAASTATALAVKTNVNVKVQATRRAVSSAVWPTLKKGETLLVRNQVCVITETDQPDLLADQQPGAALNDEADVNVNVNTKVQTNTVLALGPLRCVIGSAAKRATGRGWCVCDANLRFACKTDIECAQRFSTAQYVCIPTFACPVKGRTGYCRKPAIGPGGPGLVVDDPTH